MKALVRVCLVLLLAVSVATPVLAGPSDPLFINLTTDDSHRARMALTFGAKQARLGHPLTIWLNDEGVYLGARSKSDEYAEHQAMLAELMSAGAKVIICPLCMKHYRVAETDLISGVVLGTPELTGAALFAEGARALSW